MKKLKNKEAKLIAGIHILNNWINQDSNSGYLETMLFLWHWNCLEQAKPFPFWAYWRLIPNQYFSNGNSSRIWIIMVHDLNQKHQKHSIFFRKSTHWQQASFSNISLAINLKKVFYLSICPSIHLFIYPTIQQTFMEGLLYVVHCVRC